MATAYRSSQSVTNGTAGTSVTVSKPVGIVDTGDNPDRDQLIAFIAATGAPTFTAPAGWTLITSAVDAGSGVTLKAYRKLASSEGASWTWTLGTSQRNWGWVGAYTGVDPDNVVAAFDTDLTLTTSTTLGVLLTNFPNAGQGLGAGASVRTASGAATTWTHTGTERADLSTNAGAGTDIAGVVGDSVNSTGGTASYAPTVVASQTQTAGAFIALTLNPYFVPYVNNAGIVVEAALGVDPDSDSSTWTWTDITSYVHDPAKVVLDHGRANRTAVADPSRMAFTLVNLNGEFTSPAGAYTGYMVLNLPFRVRLNGFGISVGGNGYHRGTTFLASARPRWDAGISFVDVVAQGRLRRTQQRDDVLKSAAYTAIQRMVSTSGYATPIAHWPFEDESGATIAASAVPGVDPPARLDSISFGADTTVAGAAPLAQLAATSVIIAYVPAYTDTGTWTAMWCLTMPTEPAASTVIMEMLTTGSAYWWRINIVPGATALNLQCFDRAGATIVNQSAALTEATFYGFAQFYTLTITQNGADVGYSLLMSDATSGIGVTGTLSANTAGIVTNFTLSPQAGLAGAGFGHLALHSAPGATGIFANPAIIGGNSGDLPWARFQRICQEQNVPYIMDQTANQDLEMGPQPVATLMTLLRECETVEGCVLNDSGEFAGDTGLLWFPARDDRENIAATMTLDMGTGQVAPSFEPALDDQDIVNDVEVSRSGGSSARVTDQTSITTRGRYRELVTVNTEDDRFLRDLAGWRVNLGTVTGMRFPAVGWNMRHSPELAEAWMACRLFHRIDIVNPPSQYPPDDIQAILEGYTEVLCADEWTVRANLSPYQPNKVFEVAYDSGNVSDYVGRLAGDPDAAIRGAITSSATSIAFDPNTYRWTTVHAGLVLPGIAGSYASTPDNAALDVTGDIDIQVDVTMDDWTPAATTAFVAKWGVAGQRSYLFQLTTGGLLELAWSANGTAVSLADSTVAVPITEGRFSVRAKLDVDNGAAGRTITFETRPTSADSWTQLGSSVIQATTTSIFSGNLAVEIGAQSIGTASMLTGTVHTAKILNGIGGTEVANPDFTIQTPGATSFADAAGRTWTVNGSGVIIESEFPFDARLGGEVVTISSIATTPVTYVAGAAHVHADNAAVSPTIPGSATTDDLLLIHAAIRSSGTGTLVTPTGYTRLRVFAATDNEQLFAKVHSGSESTPSVAPSGGSAGDTVSAQMIAIRGTPTSLTDLADIVVGSATQLNASAQDVAYPGLLPTVKGCFVIACMWKQDDHTGVATLTGMTEIDDPTTVVGNDQSMAWDYQIQTLPAVVNEGSFVVSGGASAISRSAVFALAAGYQTATVTRSTNGVVKAQTAGTKIEVEDAFVLGL